METLQRLTRRQVDTLRVVSARGAEARGASLTAIATALKIRPPTALDHLTQLEGLRLVTRHRGKTRLTPRGEQTLVEYERHHRIAESLFSRLGLSAEDTCRAAREVDLAISHRTIERLCTAEGHPTECPHGERIAPCRTRDNRE